MQTANPQQLNLQLQMADNRPSSTRSNILSLIRLKPDCKLPPIRVDFEALHRPNQAHTSIIPSFNADRCFYTPAFLLSTDKKYYHENGTFQKYQFEERIQRSLSDSASLGQPYAPQDLFQPTPHSQYCQICQEKFSSYHEHISLKTHRTRVLNAEASQLIEDLCSSLRDEPQKGAGKGKTKGIVKEGRRSGCQVEKKLNKEKRKRAQEVQGSLKGQNHSTCILEDSLRSVV